MNLRLRSLSLHLVCGSLFLSTAVAQSTTRVSVSSSGAQGTWLSFDCAISGNGRFVAFQSSATNLVPGDTNANADIFVRDTASGTTERVSLATSGAQGDAGSIEPAISPDGRFVVFTSYASTFAAGDANNSADIFVRDRQLQTTDCVSKSTGGVLGNASSLTASISDDGRYVAFWSYATNLVAGDTNSATDVFVRDRQSGTLQRVSVSTGGAEGNFGAEYAALSGDGRFVAFESHSTNLATEPNGQQRDVFLRDLLLGTTTCMTIGSSGIGGGRNAALSIDGRFVLFQSDVGDHVPGDTNFGTDVFLRDRLLNTIERVNLTASGGEASNGGDDGAISADGRFVAFTSWSPNLVSGDTNNWKDVFVRDRVNGTTERMNVTTSGTQANNQGNIASISDDGRFVVFESVATNLVASDTNSSVDVFLRDRTGPPAPLPFCFGDGTGTACPCANTGSLGNGCASSTFAGGAQLVASGTAGASAGTDTLVITAINVSGPGLFFQGDGTFAAGLGIPSGDGLLCAGGNIVRLGVVFPTGNAAAYPGGLTPNPVHIAGSTSAGNVRHYQCWYRDAAVFCSASTYNLTQGLTVTWGP